jgi:hypothetical protein
MNRQVDNITVLELNIWVIRLILYWFTLFNMIRVVLYIIFGFIYLVWLLFILKTKPNVLYLRFNKILTYKHAHTCYHEYGDCD